MYLSWTTPCPPPATPKTQKTHTKKGVGATSSIPRFMPLHDSGNTAIFENFALFSETDTKENARYMSKFRLFLSKSHTYLIVNDRNMGRGWQRYCCDGTNEVTQVRANFQLGITSKAPQQRVHKTLGNVAFQFLTW